MLLALSNKANSWSGVPPASLVIVGPIAELEKSLIFERVKAGMRRARLERLLDKASATVPARTWRLKPYGKTLRRVARWSRRKCGRSGDRRDVWVGPNRPQDYKRAVVVRHRKAERQTTSKTTPRSGRRSALKNGLTEPTLFLTLPREGVRKEPLSDFGGDHIGVRQVCGVFRLSSFSQKNPGSPYRA